MRVTDFRPAGQILSGSFFLLCNFANLIPENESHH